MAGSAQGDSADDENAYSSCTTAVYSTKTATMQAGEQILDLTFELNV